MPDINIPFAGGFYQSPSLPILNQRCVNLYPNVTQAQSPYPESLFGTAGITQLATSGEINNVNRGAWVMAGIPYFVNDSKLYSLSSENVLADLGTIDGEARCVFADNGTQLFILVPNGKGYVYTVSGGLVEVTDVDFTTTNGKPQDIAYIDGFFVVSTDTKKIKQSALNDGTTWDALNFGAAEADPDDIEGLNVFRNQLYVFGTETIEPFTNAGVAGFTFSRIQGGVIPKGLSSKYAVVNTSDAIMWLGAGLNETPAIWLLSGASPQKVSTTAIDNYIATLSSEDIQSTFAWSYAQSGAYFVGFSFPSKTLVYDLITQRWHERESNILNTKGFTEDIRWRANSVVQAYNKIIVGDSQDGRIGELSLDVYQEYDRPILSYFTTQPIYNGSKSLSINKVELVTESGVGSYEEAPEVRLQVSQNGRVFSDSTTRSYGKKGEYEARAIWRKLGRFSRNAILKFTISAPYKRAIIGLIVGVRGGR